ncbi:phosphatidylinositol phosphatase PTPRQ-like, partial [Paramuricea clavata]
PESGPNIMRINATSSSSIQVTWGVVPAEDTNGIITHYFVCYKPQTSSNYICSVTKRLNGVNNRSTVLNGLNKFTNYEVAIQAATSKGNGTHGAIKNVTTLQDEPAEGPNISSIISSANELEVTWKKLSVDDSNGVITKYEVCYALGSAVSNCSTSKMLTGVDNTKTEIVGLTPVTLYTVAVRASTKVGYGPLGERMVVQTNESVPSKGPVINVMADSSTSLNVTWDELNKYDANGVITRYRVCYKNASSFEDICNLPVRETMGNVRVITLSNLGKYTEYIVAVQAATKIGFGKIGAKMTTRTKEDSKYCMLFSFLAACLIYVILISTIF